MDLSYEITGKSKAIQKKHYEWIIETKEGLPYAVFKDYYDQFRKFKSLKYEVYDANNELIKKYRLKDAFDLNFNFGNETNDVRMVIIDPGITQLPIRIKCEYEVQIDGYINLPAWSPIIDYNVQIERSSLKLNIAIKDRFSFKQINGMQEPVIVNQGDRYDFTIEYKEIAPIEYDNYSESFAKSTPVLLIKSDEFQLDYEDGKLSNWEEFGDWFLRINDSHENGLSKKTLSDLDLISNSLGSKKEIVNSIYKYMQDKTRYVSIQLGIGGFKSLPAKLVDEKGYGDCKALTNYMQKMLESVGVSSTQTLVYAGEDPPKVVVDFPSNQFNHVFLAVPDKEDTIWLECTSQQTPSNYLGTFTDGRKVLWLERGVSQLVNTPKLTSKDNRTYQDILINIDQNGDAKSEIYFIKGGVNYDDVRDFQYLDQTEINLRNYEKFSFNNFEIVDFQYSIDKERIQLEESFQLKIPSFAKSYGGRMIVDLKEFSNTHSISTDSSEHFLNIRRGKSIDQKIIIQFPEEFRLKHMAENMILENEYGIYKYEATEDQNEIIISKYYQINDGEYIGEEFIKFKEFINTVAENERSKLLFVKKT